MSTTESLVHVARMIFGPADKKSSSGSVNNLETADQMMSMMQRINRVG